MALPKAHFNAKVAANTAIKPRYRRLDLNLDSVGAEAFADVVPGTFLELQLCDVSLPAYDEIPESLADASERQIILRRPFSYCDVQRTSAGTRVDILYGIVGPGTLRMSSLQRGDRVDVLGPLGNGFEVPQDKKTALLIAGGIGVPPLMHLGRHIRDNSPQMDVAAFLGAKTMADLPLDVRIGNELGASVNEFAEMGIDSCVSTDDGSIGFKGVVTDCVDRWLDENGPAVKETILYACGPTPMLRAVAGIAEKRRIDCQISTEQMMACGIGLCQSCAIRTTNNDQTDSKRYKLCCKDGPVFDYREVDFGSEG